MDPFVQAAKRFVAHSAMLWRVGKVPVLRAVAAAEQRGDLVNALRWEEAQPECRRPLIVVEEPFEETGSYFEAVTRRVLEAYERLRKAASDTGVTLPEVIAATSSEPVVQAVKTAEVAAAGLPATLDGLTVVLAPERVQQGPLWAIQASALLKAATALAKTKRAARAPGVRWIVHDVSGGWLAAPLGEGVAFAIDDGALFAWLKKATEQAATKPDAIAAPQVPAAEPATTSADALPANGAAAVQRHVIAAAEALRAREPARAVESFRGAQSICAAEGRSVEEAGILLALAGAQLVASAPGEAVSSYQAAHVLAAKGETWTLACQAKLGEAGAELLKKRHRAAAEVYGEAAALAVKAEVPALRMEALRMAGVCHLLGGDKQEAVRFWQTAVDAGLGLDKPAREPTSFAQVANDLVELLERLGLRMQALKVRRRIAEESGASPEETPEAEAASVQAITSGVDSETTQAVPILMPRKALPFVVGNVDLGWLDAMVRAGETEEKQRTRAADAANATQKVPVMPATSSVLPFRASDETGTNATVPLRMLRKEKLTPFVPGSVDPALFRTPPEDTLDDTLDGEREAPRTTTAHGIPVAPAGEATPFREKKSDNDG